MKTTRYFEQEASRKHPEVKREWIEWVLLHPLRTETQADGRRRIWGRHPDAGGRVLRVVLLADGETVHNAFFDRDYRP